MHFGKIKLVTFILSAVFAAGIAIQPAYAVWQTLLDEHFEEDQANPNLWWPWVTHRRPTTLRWHWNALPPHRLAEPNYVRFSCWGVQNLIYNRFVVRNDDQAMWCALTFDGDPNQRRWPDEDDYVVSENAWMWWGPMDLRRAEAAVVSFWTYVDVRGASRDSLSVVIVDDSRYLTSSGATFRRRCAFGRTYSFGTEDWIRHSFSLDSMLLDGDSVSFVGERNLWLAFVWQADAFEVTGKGAFIDDVVVSYDDGLFDITPLSQSFGFVVDDTMHWTSEYPEVYDEVYPTVEWAVRGAGETPEFTIQCYLDDELFFEEVRQVRAGDGARFTSVTDTAWFVTEGPHAVRWELDTPIEDEGVIEESDEGNNVSDLAFDVVWDPAPMFEVTSPQENLEWDVDMDALEISYTISDSNEFDVEFAVFMFGTYDTTGLAENPEVGFDREVIIGSDFQAPVGENIMTWETMQRDLANGIIQVGDTLFIFGVCCDANPSNLVLSIAPGRLIVKPLDVAGTDKTTSPTEYALTHAYPNPFNRSITVEYSLPVTDHVKLNVYDMAGRLVSTLINRQVSPGLHSVNWQPTDISAGMYMLQFRSGGKVFYEKVVYTP